MSDPERAPVFVDTAQVSVRAYEIYCIRGCIDGFDVDDWLEAERQLQAGADDTDPPGVPAEVAASRTEPSAAG